VVPDFPHVSVLTQDSTRHNAQYLLTHPPVSLAPGCSTSELGLRTVRTNGGAHVVINTNSFEVVLGDSKLQASHTRRHAPLPLVFARQCEPRFRLRQQCDRTTICCHAPIIDSFQWKAPNVDVIGNLFSCMPNNMEQPQIHTAPSQANCCEPWQYDASIKPPFLNAANLFVRHCSTSSHLKGGLSRDTSNAKPHCMPT